jgi:hypothetical protein
MRLRFILPAFLVLFAASARASIMVLDPASRGEQRITTTVGYGF